MTGFLISSTENKVSLTKAFSQMQGFTYHNPTKIVFGEDAISQLKLLVPDRARILLLFGGGSVLKNGVRAQVIQALDGREIVEFSGVDANPSIETVRAAKAVFRENKLNFVLAVGGGSVIDCGKLLAAAVKYDGDAWDIVEGKHSPETAVGLGVVLTIAATGSESNSTAVISCRHRNIKKAISLPPARPGFAVMKPSILLSVPANQLENGLVDAFIHVCEQYLTTPSSGIVQQGYAEAVLKTLYTLSQSFEQHSNLAWLQNLMWAANQALCGIIGLGVPQDWATHKISAEITALYGVDHAKALSIIQPWLLRETIREKESRLLQMGASVFNMFEPSAEEVVARIVQIYQDLNMPTHLSHTGIQDPLASEKIVSALADHGTLELGTHANLTAERVIKIVRAACK